MDYKQAVFTTKYVVENKSRVVYVSHDSDGWQFFSEEKNVVEGDIRIISLENLLKANPHVKEILWIPVGMEAWINDQSENWQTGLSVSDE